MSAPHLSPSMRLNDTLYISGQLPIGFEGGIPQGIAAQTRQVIANLETILQKESLTLNDIVKTGVFIVNESDFVEFSKVYAEMFGTHKPARSTVIAGLVLPGALIEIDAIARLK